MPSLSLLVLRCRDLERSRAFYDLLDFTFTPHTHGAGPLHYAHESESFVFELYPLTSDTPDSTALEPLTQPPARRCAAASRQDRGVETKQY